MLINDAFAQAATAAAPVQNSMGGMFVQILLIFVVVYFIMIRPQQKKIKQHEAKLAAIQKGDYVITGGGILAKVEKIKGDSLEVSIAPDNKVTVLRMTIRDVISKEEADALTASEKPAAASSSKSAKAKKQ